MEGVIPTAGLHLLYKQTEQIMTREEIKEELSDVLLNLGGLSFSDVNNLLEGDSAITFEGEDLIKIAEYFYNYSKKKK